MPIADILLRVPIMKKDVSTNVNRKCRSPRPGGQFRLARRRRCRNSREADVIFDLLVRVFRPLVFARKTLKSRHLASAM
jgi:hypothetical protein